MSKYQDYKDSLNESEGSYEKMKTAYDWLVKYLNKHKNFKLYQDNFWLESSREAISIEIIWINGDHVDVFLKEKEYNRGADYIVIRFNGLHGPKEWRYDISKIKTGVPAKIKRLLKETNIK